MSREELTPEQRQRVDDIRDAVLQEFSEGAGSSKTTLQEVEDLKEDALTALRHALKHSQNEKLKVDTSRWVIDTILESKRVGDGGLTAFLEGMEASKTP